MTAIESSAFPPLVSEANRLPYAHADGEGIDYEPFDAFLPFKETVEWFRAWTGNPNADASMFRVFGQDGTGGYAAFWLVRETKDLLKQPVVFLGSEGETAVVARDFCDYLWLLAGGIGPCEATLFPDAPRVAHRKWKRLRARMRGRSGLLPMCCEMRSWSPRTSRGSLSHNVANGRSRSCLNHHA